MGSLRVVVTSPRIPGGLLTAAAWSAIGQAALVVAADPDGPLAQAVAAEGVEVVGDPGATVAAMTARAAAAGDVVWLWSDDAAGADAMLRQLAADVVARAESGGDGPPPEPAVEVIVGSFDPPGARLLDLVEVMDRLRRECPWDRKQTHESLVQYLVEEAYETIEAIETGDRDHLREELGDLLLQVMFHARVASEDPDRPFAIDDVAAGIVEKLIGRHPHVFGDADASDAAAVEANWELIKAAEKGRTSSMDGIPAGLPALAWADKVVGRASRSGLGSTSLGTASTSASDTAPEPPALSAEAVGAALFDLVVAARSAGVDPEQALRARVREEIDAVRSQEAEAPQE